MKVYDRSKYHDNLTKKVAKTTSAKAKNLPLFSKNLKNNKKNEQDSFTRAKETAQLTYAEMQKNLQQGWEKTRAWLMVGIALAITFAQKNMRRAQEKLGNAQENLQKVQGPIQSNVKTGLTKTSKVIDKSTNKAKYGLQQATTKAKKLQDSWQEQTAQRQRKRKRAKSLFRWGLILGVALALLYSPIAGSEVRQRIGKGWQQSSALLKSRNRNVRLSA